MTSPTVKHSSPELSRLLQLPSTGIPASVARGPPSAPFPLSLAQDEFARSHSSQHALLPLFLSHRPGRLSPAGLWILCKPILNSFKMRVVIPPAPPRSTEPLCPGQPALPVLAPKSASSPASPVLPSSLSASCPLDLLASPLLCRPSLSSGLEQGNCLLTGHPPSASLHALQPVLQPITADPP